MSWMDDMWINTKSAANAVGQKTGEVIDRSKLRLAIIDLKSDLSHKYAVLGKLCYESYRTGKDYAKEMIPEEQEEQGKEKKEPSGSFVETRFIVSPNFRLPPVPTRS